MHSLFSNKMRVIAGLLIGTVPLAVGCQQRTAEPATPVSQVSAQRGQYLVSIAVCNDCHTPWKMGANGPEPDMSRMLSGHPESAPKLAPLKLSGKGWEWTAADTMTAFSGPWGISYTANLTPDENTGIGIWDEDMFVKTIRNGRHMGEGRPLQPPMPWPWFAKMTDDDLKSVFAYLRTIPPIQNRVPDYQPPPDAK